MNAVLKRTARAFAFLALVAATPVVAQSGGSTVQQPVQQAAPSAPAIGETVADSASRTQQASRQIMHELSPWSMFMSADIVVKAVMIGLAFASLVTWTIFLAKSVELLLAQRRLGEALAGIDKARSLAEAQVALGKQRNILASFVGTAISEVRLSAGASSEGGIKERAASRFVEITRTESRQMRRGMGLLATIGATAPFVGLFGTVWGIMNSFIGISKAQTTNLAVVAPGIAEALLATAIGLVAAIPAVIIYNHFSRQTKTYIELVGRGSGAAGRLLSRDLDRANSNSFSRAAE